MVDLGFLDEEYGNAEVKDYDEIPDGRYIVLVESIAIEQAKSSSAYLLKWGLRILVGPHTGRWLFRNNVLTAEQIPWLKKDMLRCDMTIKPSELSKRSGELLRMTLQVSKKGDNVYINRRIRAEDQNETPS